MREDYKEIKELATNYSANDSQREVLEEMILAVGLSAIQKRMKRGKELAAKKGRFIGGTVPFGYKINKNKEYEIDKNTCEIVSEIFQLFQEGNSINKIAKRLDSYNILTPRDYKSIIINENVQERHNWSPSTIKSILSNSIYMGYLVYGKTESCGTFKYNRPEEEWIRIKKVPLQMISEQEFYSVQEILNSKRKYKGFRK